MTNASSQRRARRVAIGLKQSDVARAIDISQATYSRIECGRIRPDNEMMQRIARVLRAPVHDLFDDGATVIAFPGRT